MAVRYPICHLFYHPAQVVLVDDDPDFLDTTSRALGQDQSHRLFHSATQALRHINRSTQHADMMRRCCSSSKTGARDSDRVYRVHLDEIYKEVYNAERFVTATVVVVNFAMSEMNGLDFCTSLLNPYVKKILITDQEDTELAIAAFNDGLIDQYLCKNDEQFERRLKRAIANLQQLYFSRSFKLLTDPVIASDQCLFLSHPEFIDFFQELQEHQEITEYYVIDEPYSGFFMLDGKGTVSILLVLPEEELQRHLRHCRALNAPPALLDALEAGTVMPLFDVADPGLAGDTAMFENWEEHYVQAARLSDTAPWYCALLTADVAQGLLRDFRPAEVQTRNTHTGVAVTPQKYVH